MTDVFDIFKKYNNDPLWCCNGRGGIGGSHFFKWMVANNVDYRSYYSDIWSLYIKEFPEYNKEDFKIMGGEIHCHYYECGH